MAGDYCNMEIEENTSLYSPTYDHRYYDFKPIKLNLNPHHQPTPCGYFTSEACNFEATTNETEMEIPSEVIVINDDDETMEVPSETFCQLSGRKQETCSDDRNTPSSSELDTLEKTKELLSKLKPEEVSISPVSQETLRKNQRAMAVIPEKEGQTQVTENPTSQEKTKASRDLQSSSLKTTGCNILSQAADLLSDGTSEVKSSSSSKPCESAVPSHFSQFSEDTEPISSPANDNNSFTPQNSLVEYIRRYSQEHQLVIFPYCDLSPISPHANPSMKTPQLPQNLQWTPTAPSTSTPRSNISPTNLIYQQEFSLSNNFSVSRSFDNYQVLLQKKKQDLEILLEKWNACRDICNKVFDVTSKYLSKSEHNIINKPVSENAKDKECQVKNNQLATKNDEKNNSEEDDINNNIENKTPVKIKSIICDEKIEHNNSDVRIFKSPSKKVTFKDQINKTSKNSKQTEIKNHKTTKSEQESKKKRRFHETSQNEKNRINDHKNTKRSKTSNNISESGTNSKQSKKLVSKNNQEKLAQDNAKHSDEIKTDTKLTDSEPKQKLLIPQTSSEKNPEIDVFKNELIVDFTLKEPTIDKNKYMLLDPRLQNKQNHTGSNPNLSTDCLVLNLSKDSQTTIVPTTLTTTQQYYVRKSHGSHERKLICLKKINPFNYLDTSKLNTKQQPRDKLLSNTKNKLPENTPSSKSIIQVSENSQSRPLNLSISSSDQRYNPGRQNHEFKPNYCNVNRIYKSEHKLASDFKPFSIIERKSSNEAGSNSRRNSQDIPAPSHSSQDKSYNERLDLQTRTKDNNNISRIKEPQPTLCEINNGTKDEKNSLKISSQPSNTLTTNRRVHQLRQQPGHSSYQHNYNYGHISYNVPRTVYLPKSPPKIPVNIACDFTENGLANKEPNFLMSEDNEETEEEASHSNYNHYMKARTVQPFYMNTGNPFSIAHHPSNQHLFPYRPSVSQKQSSSQWRHY